MANDAQSVFIAYSTNGISSMGPFTKDLIKKN